MPHHHIPDLDALQKLSDKEVQFYSVIGAVVSLAAALDLTYLDLYAKGTGLNSNTAGRILFLAKNSSLQRDMASAAIEAKVADDAALLGTWRSLRNRLERATGQSGLRHLVAHNTVTRIEISGAVGGAPIASLAVGGGSEESFHVFQNQQKIVAGYKPRQAAISNLLDFARELAALLNDLDGFLKRVP